MGTLEVVNDGILVFKMGTVRGLNAAHWVWLMTNVAH